MVITANNRRLTDADPAAGVARRLPQQFRNQTLYILCSPLLGAGLGCLHHIVPPASAILLVELHRDLAELRHDRRWEIGALLNRQIHWAPDIQTAQRIADEQIRFRGIRAVELVHLTGGAGFAREHYQWLQRQLTSLVRQYWKNRAAMIRLGRRWIANTVHNSGLSVRPLPQLSARIHDPVLLCGAGPQLDEFLPWIASIRQQCTLIALDTALPTLAAAGIEPDVIWAMDGQVANALDLMPWRWETVAVAVDLTSHPTFLRRFAPSRRFAFLTEYTTPLPVATVLPPGIPLLPPRGSVAPSAVEGLVRWCGVRRILAVGVDFWYHAPKSHSTMSAPHRWVMHRQQRLSGTGGDQRLMVRPMQDVQLRDGSPARGDAILADQAAQVAYTVASLRRDFPDLECYTLSAPGLDTGMTELTRDRATEWLATSSVVVPAGTEHSAVEHPPLDAPSPGRSPGRPDALAELIFALRRQEAHMSNNGEGPVFLCEDVRFVLFDLPQWPLLELQQEWVQLHRGAILRSLRDYRRRFEHEQKRQPPVGGY